MSGPLNRTLFRFFRCLSLFVVLFALGSVVGSFSAAAQLSQTGQSAGGHSRQCPSGTRGVYPKCVPNKPKKCRPGYVGKPPVCIKIVKPKCPSGTTGTFPYCKQRVVRPKKCPPNMYGTYPNCKKRSRPTKPKKQITKPKSKPKRTQRATRRSQRRVTSAGQTQRPDEVVVVLDLTQGGNVPLAIAQQYRLIRLQGNTVGLLQARVQRYRIPDGRSVGDVLSELGNDPRIRTVQPNFLYRTSAAGTKPKARSRAKMQYAVSKLRLSKAHVLAQGRRARIAVIDSGVDEKHPELANAVAGRFNAVGDRDARADSHGTAVAGIIAAQKTLMGAAPMARLLAVRAFFREGKSQPLTTSFILLKAIDWSYENKARILNMSFTSPAQDPAVHDILKAAQHQGLVLVAAAGNGGPKAGDAYPAAYPEVIAVTATDKKDRLYRKANRGRYVDVAAPGVGILTSVPRGGYDFKTGTSFAAPYVSAMVALMLERNSAMKADKIRSILRDTAQDLGPAGPDAKFGAGRADAFAMMEKMLLGRISSKKQTVTLPSLNPALSVNAD